jgi:heat-inducible transcriptional repressor
LDEQGYVTQRHTSGGRLPTELGYRYFVQKLLGDFRLPLPEQQMIRHQFHQARLDLNQWMRLAAAILARTSQGASLVTSPHPRPNRFKHIQLISTQGRMVLMIIVLFGGDVHQQMLTLAEPISQARLSVAAERLNELWDNADYDDISSRMHHGLDTLEFEITRLILEVLHRADNRPFSNFYRDGLANIIEDEGTRQAVRVLEERSLLANVLMESQVPNVGDVQVLIGGETRWEELKDCTVILSRYGVVEQFSGTVAVIGPVRMPYRRNVAAVRYVTDLMSNFLGDYYTLEAPDMLSEETEEDASE